MRIAVLASDPITAESLGCLLANSGGHEVVMCACHLGDLRSIDILQPELFVVTEGFDDPAHQMLLRTLREKGIRVILLADSSSAELLSQENDYVIARSNGVGALFAVILKLGGGSGAYPRGHGLAVSENLPPAVSHPKIPALTAREREAADLVAQGHRDREIASLMGTGEQNVKALISRARRLLGCKNRTELAILMNRATNR